MANIDLLQDFARKTVIDEIKGEENKVRKAESLRRFEVYRERQGRYILEKLREEFTEKTIRNMRKILSINLTKKIINETASIYNSGAERTFGNVSEREQMQLENLYFYANADVQLKNANRYFKLFDQCLLQVLPKDGKICLRALAPHQYDVIPDANDPEKPYAIIMNVFDKFEWLQQETANGDLSRPRTKGTHQSRNREILDNNNQAIADAEDYKKKLERYIVWTKDLHFTMDGHGNILTEEVVNPIGRLPFVDIADEKDFEYFVRRGNGTVDFALEYGVLLSDTADINRLQGYSQAVIVSEELPENIAVGSHRILHLPVDRDSGVTPSFEFATPSPDMASSLELLETYLRLFLSSRGIDPKTISGKAEGNKFSSGIERLLSMIDKFEASRSDIDLFKQVEEQVFELMVAWSNVYQGVKTNGLRDELQISTINNKATLEVKFAQPNIVQTKAELEDSVIKLVDNGLMSKKEALMKLREVDEDMAEKILMEIEEDFVTPPPTPTTDEDNGQTEGEEIFIESDDKP